MNSLLLRSFAAGLLGCASTSVGAQIERSPGQVLPPDFRPRPDGPGDSPVTQRPRPSPAATGGVEIAIADVVVENGFPELGSATEAIVAPLRGRNATTTILFDAAARIEQAYADAGYALIRVVVPDQETRRDGGVYRLQVIDGYVESVDASSVSPAVRRQVYARVQRLVGKRHLRRAEFERILLLAGDAALGQLRSALSPGSVTSAVKLTLASDLRAVSFGIGIDNSFSEALGTTSLTLTSILNSPFGQSEQIYAAVGGHPTGHYLQRLNRRRYFALGAIAPIGHDGLSINVEGVHATTRPHLPAGAIPTASRYDRLSVRISYQLVRRRAQTLTIRGSFDLIDEKQRAIGFGTDLYADRLRPARIGLNWRRVGRKAGTELDLEISQGIHGLGSRSAEDATVLRPLSRRLAGDDFTKIEARGRVDFLPAPKWRFTLTGQAQLSLSGPLLLSEQFTLGGPQDLSSYDLGRFAGDDGWSARVELGRNLILSRRGFAVELYGFAATGTVYLRRPTIIEQRATAAHSIGAGLNLIGAHHLSGMQQASLRLEAGHSLAGSAGRPDGWRANVALNLRF